MTSSNLITDITQLDALYGDASPRSLTKEIDALNFNIGPLSKPRHLWPLQLLAWRALIVRLGANREKCAADANTIQFADRRGNNRLDTLRNIVDDDCIRSCFYARNR